MTDIEKPICDLGRKKVLLINPPWKIASNNVWKSVASCYPSIGLALIASYLEHCNAKVEIIDMQATSGDDSLLHSVDKPDFVGITSTTVIFNEACKTAEMIRGLWEDVKIVLGGVHPTIMPEEVLKKSPADYVIIGEGEKSMAKLVAGFPPEQIEGLAMNLDGNYWAHPRADYIEDINLLPMPSYHLLPMDNYRPPMGGALRSPAMSIFSSRGCPGQCTYCNSALGKKIRFKKYDILVGEIEHLVENYGIKEIGFCDDTFCASPSRVRKICKLLMDKKIDITWSCMSRINFADSQTLTLMAQSGCHMICYGVESADEQILKNIKKGIRLEDVKPVVDMTREAGISVRLSIMLGNPGETLETMEKTLDFVIKADPDLAQFNITTPYPGTEMFKWADENGYLIHKQWEQYDLRNVVMNLPTVSPEKVYNFYNYSYRRFFLRWSFFRRLMKRFFINLLSRNDSATKYLKLLKSIRQ
jgi:anaerobic magnesium-protoporphyrin IX monomethyl ester cyclase